MVLKTFLTVVLFTSAVMAEKIELSQINSLVTVGAKASPKMAFDHKKETILYFWATWCPDCKEKLTTIFQNKSLYERYNVYLVSTDKDIEKVEFFKNKNGLVNHVYLDADKKLQKSLKVFSVPTLVKLKSIQNELNIVKVQTGGDITEIIK